MKVLVCIDLTCEIVRQEEAEFHVARKHIEIPLAPFFGLKLIVDFPADRVPYNFKGMDQEYIREALDNKGNPAETQLVVDEVCWDGKDVVVMAEGVFRATEKAGIKEMIEEFKGMGWDFD